MPSPPLPTSRFSLETAREQHLARGIQVFQRYSVEPLSREDVQEIDHNLTGFCRVLMKWHRQDQEAARASGERATTTPAATPPPAPPRTSTRKQRAA